MRTKQSNPKKVGWSAATSFEVHLLPAGEEGAIFSPPSPTAHDLLRAVYGRSTRRPQLRRVLTPPTPVRATPRGRWIEFPAPVVEPPAVLPPPQEVLPGPPAEEKQHDAPPAVPNKAIPEIQVVGPCAGLVVRPGRVPVWDMPLARIRPPRVHGWGVAAPRDADVVEKPAPRKPVTLGPARAKRSPGPHITWADQTAAAEHALASATGRVVTPSGVHPRPKRRWAVRFAADQPDPTGRRASLEVYPRPKRRWAARAAASRLSAGTQRVPQTPPLQEQIGVARVGGPESLAVLDPPGVLPRASPGFPRPAFAAWVRYHLDRRTWPHFLWEDDERTRFVLPWRRVNDPGWCPEENAVARAWWYVGAGRVSSGRRRSTAPAWDHGFDSLAKTNLRNTLVKTGFELVPPPPGSNLTHRVYCFPPSLLECAVYGSGGGSVEGAEPANNNEASANDVPITERAETPLSPPPPHLPVPKVWAPGHNLSSEQLTQLQGEGHRCTRGCNPRVGHVPADGLCGYHAIAVHAGLGVCGHTLLGWLRAREKAGDFSPVYKLPAVRSKLPPSRWLYTDEVVQICRYLGVPVSVIAEQGTGWSVHSSEPDPWLSPSWGDSWIWHGRSHYEPRSGDPGVHAPVISFALPDCTATHRLPGVAGESEGVGYLYLYYPRGSAEPVAVDDGRYQRLLDERSTGHDGVVERATLALYDAADKTYAAALAALSAARPNPQGSVPGAATTDASLLDTNPTPGPTSGQLPIANPAGPESVDPPLLSEGESVGTDSTTPSTPAPASPMWDLLGGVRYGRALQVPIGRAAAQRAWEQFSALAAEVPFLLCGVAFRFWAGVVLPYAGLAMLVMTILLSMLPLPLAAPLLTGLVLVGPVVQPMYFVILACFAKAVCLPAVATAALAVVALHLFRGQCAPRVPWLPGWWCDAYTRSCGWALLVPASLYYVIPVPYAFHALLPWGGSVVRDSITLRTSVVQLGGGWVLVPAWTSYGPFSLAYWFVQAVIRPLSFASPAFVFVALVVIYVLRRYQPHFFCVTFYQLDLRCNACCTMNRTLRFFGSVFTVQSDTFCSACRYNCLHVRAGHKHKPPPYVLRLALGTSGPGSKDWVQFVDQRPTGYLPTATDIKAWRPSDAVYAVHTEAELLLLSTLAYCFDTPVLATRVSSARDALPTTEVNAAGMRGYRAVAALPGYNKLPQPRLTAYGSPHFVIGPDVSVDSVNVRTVLTDTFILYGLVPVGYVPLEAELVRWRDAGITYREFTHPRPLSATVFARHSAEVQAAWIAAGYTGFSAPPRMDVEISSCPFYWRAFSPDELEFECVTGAVYIAKPTSFAGARVEAVDFDGLRMKDRTDLPGSLQAARTLGMRTISVALSFGAAVDVDIPEPLSGSAKSLLLEAAQSGASLGALLSYPELRYHVRREFTSAERADLGSDGVPVALARQWVMAQTMVLRHTVTATGPVTTVSGAVSATGDVVLVAGGAVWEPTPRLVSPQAYSFKVRFLAFIVLSGLAGALHWSLTEFAADPGLWDWAGFWRGRHLLATVFSGVSFMNFPSVLALNVCSWLVGCRALGLWSDLPVALAFFSAQVLLMPWPLVQALFLLTLPGLACLTPKMLPMVALIAASIAPAGSLLVLAISQLLLRVHVFAFGVTNQSFHQAAARNWYITPAIASMLTEATGSDINRLTSYATTEGPCSRFAQTLLSVMCDGQARVYRGSGLFDITPQCRSEAAASPLAHRIVTISSPGGTGHGFIVSAGKPDRFSGRVCYKVDTVRHAATGKPYTLEVSVAGVSLSVERVEYYGELARLVCSGPVFPGDLDFTPLAKHAIDPTLPVIYHTLDGAFELDVAVTPDPCPVGATVAGDSGSVLTQCIDGVYYVVGYHQGVSGPFAVYVSHAGNVLPPISQLTRLDDSNLPYAWRGDAFVRSPSQWCVVTTVSARGKHELAALDVVLGPYGERVARQSSGGAFELTVEATALSLFFSWFGLLTIRRAVSGRIPVFMHAATSILLGEAFCATFRPAALTAAYVFLEPEATVNLPLTVPVVVVAQAAVAITLLWHAAARLTTSYRSFILAAIGSVLASVVHRRFTLALIPLAGLHWTVSSVLCGLALMADLAALNGHIWPYRYVALLFDPILKPKPRQALALSVLRHVPSGYELAFQTKEGPTEVVDLTTSEFVTAAVAEEEPDIARVLEAAMGQPSPVVVETLVMILASYTGLDQPWEKPQTFETDSFDNMSTDRLRAMVEDHPEAAKIRKVLNRRAAFVAMMESRLAAAARAHSEKALQAEVLPRVWGAVKATLARVNSACAGDYVLGTDLAEVQERASASGRQLVDYARIPSLGFCLGRAVCVADIPADLTPQLDDARRLKVLKRVPKVIGSKGGCGFTSGGKLVASTFAEDAEEGWALVRFRGADYYADPGSLDALARLVLQTTPPAEAAPPAADGSSDF